MDTSKQVDMTKALRVHEQDRDRFFYVMAAAHRLFPFGRYTHDTTAQDAANRRIIEYVAAHLPSEHLQGLAEFARLVHGCPEEIEHAIDYNSRGRE